MSFRRLVRKLTALLAPVALVAAGASTTLAQTGSTTGSMPAKADPTAAALRTIPPVPAAYATKSDAPPQEPVQGIQIQVSPPAGAVQPVGCATGSCGAHPACAVNAGCGACQKKDCPPKFVFCTPEPPKLKFKCTCPKPVCDPCNLDPTGNYGYTPTCWRPAMAPPNYSHCPVPTPTQLAPPYNAALAPVPPPVTPEKELPPPPKLESHFVPPAPEHSTPTISVLPPPSQIEIRNVAPTAPMEVAKTLAPSTSPLTIVPPPPVTTPSGVAPAPAPSTLPEPWETGSKGAPLPPIH